MKTIAISLMCFFLGSSCISNKYTIVPEKISSVFRIQSIDSTENNYIIYAIHKGMTYKLVSRKNENPLNCSAKIRVESRSRLNLKSVFGRKLTTGPQTSHYQSTTFFNGEDVMVDENENIVRDIYKIENVKGLCLEEL